MKKSFRRFCLSGESDFVLKYLQAKLPHLKFTLEKLIPNAVATIRCEEIECYNDEEFQIDKAIHEAAEIHRNFQ